jgi:hypothetical protein
MKVGGKSKLTCPADTLTGDAAAGQRDPGELAADLRGRVARHPKPVAPDKKG